MASQPGYRYELIKLAEKLDKDYYSLTELLCKNAQVQAEWLHQDNAELTAYLTLYAELNEKISYHVALGREILSGLKSKKAQPAVFNSLAFGQSRISITNILAVIQGQAAIKKIGDWKEMHENLRMQLIVLNTLLTELFQIEEAHLIPLLEKNTTLN